MVGPANISQFCYMYMINKYCKNYANKNKSLVCKGSLALIKCTMGYHICTYNVSCGVMLGHTGVTRYQINYYSPQSARLYTVQQCCMNSQTMRLMYISFTESQSNHIYVLSFTYKLAPRSSSTYIQYRVVELCKTRLGPPEGYQACVFGDCPMNGGSQRGQLVLGEIRWESGNLGNQNVSVNAVKLVETKWHHHFLQTCSFLYTRGYFLQFVCLLIYRLPYP